MTDTIRIERIAAGGDGVGRLADGRAVFVPRSAPGDLAQVRIVRQHARFARAELTGVLEPGPGRTLPRCRHYQRDGCGGCQLQHLDTATQHAAYRGIVGDALRRLARLDVPDPPLEPSRDRWNYRTRIALARDRTGRGPGYHRRGHPGEVFDLERCEIAAEPLNALWAALATARIPWPRDAAQVLLGLGRDGSRHVTVRAASRPSRAVVGAIAAAGASVWWSAPGARPKQLAGKPGGSVGVFEQAHPGMGDRVREWAVDCLGQVTGRHVWDLFAGIGDTTRLLAAGGATVESVERDAAAVELARRTGPAEGVRRHAQPVEAVIARLERPHAVVTNPPRTGLAAAVVARLLVASPLAIVYVSCDPATLARDVARLAGAYRVTDVRAFDLFPQTAHVETVVRLERR